jgi:diguanylate cyclase
MGVAGTARQTTGVDDLFARIGAFLADHQLACDPATYAFVHALMSVPDGLIAAEVARLIDGGVRLTRADVERLGGRIAAKSDLARTARAEAPPTGEDAARLVAETQAQVDGFAMIMRAMQVETRGFGRDLAQTAAASLCDSADLSRIAGAMIARVRQTEAQLEKATHETDALRTKLVDAQATARRDHLTAMPNRLAFNEAFLACAGMPGPHCLALCDVDRFKRINDEHGHGVGDRVLTAIGEALTDACAGHLVARHGGEEFAVLLTGTVLVDAVAQLDRAREQIASKRFRNRETGAALGLITCSAGVVAIRPGENVEEATGRADRLLYAAKDQGRDQVCAG